MYYRDDPDLLIQTVSGEAFKEIGKNIIKFVINLLKNVDISIKTSAINALRIIGDTEAVEPLLNLLNYPNFHIRSYALMALSTFTI